MNEQLQKELAAWLSQLRAAAEKGGDFVLTQAPLVVQEKIAYGRASELLGLLIGIAIFCGGVYCCKRAQRWDRDHDHPFGYIGAVLGVLVGVLLTIFQIDAVMKAWLAPRLYVIEWLASLVNAGN